VSPDGRFLYVRQFLVNIYIIDRYREEVVRRISRHPKILFDVAGNVLVCVCQFTDELIVYDPITDIEQIYKLPLPVMAENAEMNIVVDAIAADLWTTNSVRVALLVTQINKTQPAMTRYLCLLTLPQESGTEIQYEQIIPYAYLSDSHLALAFQPEGNTIVVSGSPTISPWEGKKYPLVQLDLRDSLHQTPFSFAGYEDYHIYYPTWSLDGRYVGFYFFKPPDSKLGGIAVAHSGTSPGIQLTGPQEIDTYGAGSMGWTVKNELVFCAPNPMTVHVLRQTEAEEKADS